MIGSDPDMYLAHLLRRWAGNFDALTQGSLADYHDAFRRPEVIHATCNDYRAGASIDRVSTTRPAATLARKSNAPCM